MTPYYQDNLITLYHGDSREILPRLDVQAIVSDPPYGIGYQHGGGGGGKHNRRNTQPILGDNEPFDPSWLLIYDTVLLWGANHYLHKLPDGRWLVWDKLDGLESYDNFSDVEFAWVNKKGAARIFRYLWKGICQAGDKKWGRLHPSQKPVPLMAWCLEFVPNNQLVVDPYMGSGTTLVAAKQIGRKSVLKLASPPYSLRQPEHHKSRRLYLHERSICNL